MKLKWTTVLAIGFFVARANADESLLLKTPVDMMNYGVGVEITRNLKQLGIEIDPELVMKGVRDALTGEKLLVPEGELRRIVMAVQTEQRQKRALANMRLAADNKSRGEAFLEENRHKQGVITLPSGLQYTVLTIGNGNKPTDADAVEIRYRGTLIDGTEFDNSDRSGKPAVFKVTGGVIPGCGEALKLMPVGSKWRLFIPPHLAYGERGLGRAVGSNATLIYELELVAIK